jgi:hypothetical protein
VSIFHGTSPQSHVSHVSLAVSLSDVHDQLLANFDALCGKNIHISLYSLKNHKLLSVLKVKLLGLHEKGTTKHIA